MASSEEKIYPASPRKRKEAREKGQVAKSTELIAILTLFGSLMFIYISKEKIFTMINELLLITFTNINQDIAPNVLIRYMTLMLKFLIPLLAIIMIASFMGNFLQIGLILSPKAIQPDFSKINPINGFKKMFSKDSFVELGKSLIKIIAVFYIAYSSIRKSILQVNYSYTENLHNQFIYIFDGLFGIIMKVGIFLLILSFADMLYKRFSFEKELKMTREEMIEEYKKEEGNPHVKQKQKEFSRMLLRRNITKVKDATVVITNPTHFACAIKYDPVTHPVPILLFKGVDEIAQEAKKLARESDVPIIENKPLARAIYAKVKEDEAVPQELFQAVAAVIAYVYSMDNQNVNTEI